MAVRRRRLLGREEGRHSVGGTGVCVDVTQLDRYVRARLGRGQRDRLVQTANGTGYQGDLVAEVEAGSAGSKVMGQRMARLPARDPQYGATWRGVVPDPGPFAGMTIDIGR